MDFFSPWYKTIHFLSPFYSRSCLFSFLLSLLNHSYLNLKRNGHSLKQAKVNSGLSCDQRRPSDLSPLSPGHANGRSVVCWEPLMMAYHTAGPPKSSFTSLMVTFPSTPLFKLKKKKNSVKTTGGITDAIFKSF